METKANKILQENFWETYIYKANSTDILLFDNTDLRKVNVYFEIIWVSSFLEFIFENDCTICPYFLDLYSF